MWQTLDDLCEFQLEGMQQSLDCYPVWGEWTPQIAGTITPGVHTYLYQVGTWHRVGPLVTIWARISLSALDPAIEGNFCIIGQPFAGCGVQDHHEALAISEYSHIPFGIEVGFTQLGASIDGATPNIILPRRSGPGKGGAQIPVSCLTDTSAIMVGGSYLTDD